MKRRAEAIEALVEASTSSRLSKAQRREAAENTVSDLEAQLAELENGDGDDEEIAAIHAKLDAAWGRIALLQWNDEVADLRK